MHRSDLWYLFVRHCISALHCWSGGSPLRLVEEQML